MSIQLMKQGALAVERRRGGSTPPPSSYDGGLLLNGSFEDDSDSDGLCDSWVDTHTTALPPTYTRVGSGTKDGSYAQRMYYHGDTADNGSKGIQIRQTTAAGTVGVGVADQVTFSVWISGSFVAAYGYIGIESQTSTGAYIGEADQVFTPTGTPQLVTVTYTLPATASRVAVFIAAPELDFMSVVDLTFDSARLDASVVVPSSLVTIGSSSFTLTGTNPPAGRGTNQLVVFRSPIAVTTTNSAGTEMTVNSSNIVTAINDRQATNKTGNFTFVKNGYTLNLVLLTSTPTTRIDGIRQVFFTIMPQIVAWLNPAISKTVSITIDPSYNGVAYTAWDGSPDGHITVSSAYWNANPNDLDVITHEAAHVVQNYTSAGGWEYWTEGLADFCRWKFGIRNASTGWSLASAPGSGANYTSSYQTTARFLVWLSDVKQANITQLLDARLRAGTYADTFWTSTLGASVTTLWAQYKAATSWVPPTSAADTALILSPGTDVPASPGYVLSGNGTARTWLLANATIGATVQLGAAPIVEKRVYVGALSYALTGTNPPGGRGTDQLVAFKSPLTVTPTDTAGVEMTVNSSSVVVGRNDRKSTSGTFTYTQDGNTLSLVVPQSVSASLIDNARQTFFTVFGLLQAYFNQGVTRKTVQITIDPTYVGAGATNSTGILVSRDYWVANQWDMDILTHELAHWVQEYSSATYASYAYWTEGIASWASGWKFRQNSASAPGWSPPGPGANYTDSYGTTARFLLWLDTNQLSSWTPDIAQYLDTALREETYEESHWWPAITERTVASLWSEYKAATSWVPPAYPARTPLVTAPGTPIPASPGYVLSGNGAARTWLLNNVGLGSTVVIA